MKVNDIKNNLKSALEKSTPDCYENIKKGVYTNIQINNAEEKKVRKITFNLKRSALLIACMAFLVIGIGSYYIPVNDIYLDVNPSIEIKVNLFDKVISVKALNDDGTAITDILNVKNKKIETAIDDIINVMIDQGYIASSADDNAILVSVEAKSGKSSQKISQNIDEAINNKLTQNNISAVVINQDIESLKNLQDTAKEKGVSVGKLQLIQKMIKEEDHVDIESLYDLKVRELLEYFKKNNIFSGDPDDEIDDILEKMNIQDDEDDEDDDSDDDDKNDKNSNEGKNDKNIEKDEKENKKDKNDRKEDNNDNDNDNDYIDNDDKSKNEIKEPDNKKQQSEKEKKNNKDSDDKYDDDKDSDDDDDDKDNDDNDD